MSAARTHQLTLGHVTLHLPEGMDNRDQWRRRVVDALGRAAVYPSLPPQAILVVRRMPDLQPGLLLGENSWRGAQQWSSRTQSWLDACWRRAARPAYEVVPATADAVWFADVAEWLACLSWDVYGGLTTTRWWWETWLRRIGYGNTGDMLYRLWQDEARWLPQALATVHARHGQGVQALSMQLTTAQAQHVLQLVLACYDLPAAIKDRQELESLGCLLPNSVQRVIQNLPPQNAALAAVCLDIVHAPAVTRRHLRASVSPHGVREEQRSEQAGMARRLGQRSPPLADARAAPSMPAVPNPVAIALGSATDIARPVAAPVVRQEDGTAQDAAQARGSDVASLARHSLPVPDEPEDRPHARVETPAGPDARAAADAGVEHATPDVSGARSDGDHAQPATVANADAEQGVQTQFGGLWYLVNVLAELGWVEAGANALDAWHKLAGLAQAMVGSTDPDSVWELLAAQTAGEASHEILAEWLAEAYPVVEEYIAARLELPAEFTDALRDPATLYVTRTHVDVAFSIDHIRLELRAAGMDRDPGWIPELGRVVALHYA